MGETEFINHPPPVLVPRRSWWFLWVINNFPYIMALPAAAAIFGMRLPLKLTLGLSAGAVILVLAFWKAYQLNLQLEQASHPHNRRWNLLARAMKPAAHMLSAIPVAWYTIIFWTVASLINILTLMAWPESGAIYLAWLLYIPVVIWPSYRLPENASYYFGLTWLFSAIMVSLAHFYLNPLPITWLTLSGWMSHLGWFAFFSLFFHYMLRRLAIFRSQFQLSEAIIEQLRIERGYSAAFDARPLISSEDDHLNQIAEAIGKKLNYERVFIHILDGETQQLFTKGRFGKNLSEWPAAGWPTRGDPSITGWVVEHKQPHLCGDTDKCDLFYNQNHHDPCLSEAVVPIIAEDEVVGLIDIESSLRFAYNREDVQFLWQIANSIGAALASERHVSREVEKAYRLMEDTARMMVTSRSLDEALEKIAQQACELFGADLVSIYKHAVSTRVPLPGLIFHGNAWFPSQLGNKIPSNSRVNELLHYKDDLYIQPYADSDDLLLGPNKGKCTEEEARELGHPLKFVTREGIKSTVYVKLGLGPEVVGSLFLNYRQRTFFQKNQISALRAFAKTLAMALILKRQIERANGPLAGAIPLAHSQAEAAFESVRRKFYEIPLDQMADCEHCENVNGQLKEFKSRLEMLERQWNNLILVEQRELRGSSLAEPIIHLESKLRAMFPAVQLKWNIKEFLYIPSDDFGEMVYKVVAEGVSNALVHGKAGNIAVKSVVQDNHLVLTIANNGISIDAGRAEKMNAALEQLSNPTSEIGRLLRVDIEAPDEDSKATGIFQILKDAWRWFGARSSFTPDASGGTVLMVSFPLGLKFSRSDEGLDDDEDEN